MPRNWVVSCHAGATLQGVTAHTIATELVQVKPGITFMQFGDEANPLGSDVGWQAYHALMKNPPDFDAARKIKNCKEFTGVVGARLPNYKMIGDNWIDSNNLLASGVFVAGDTWHKDPMTVYLQPGGNSWSLKEFLADPEVKSGDVVWWLACRSWMRSGYPVNFPSQPVPQPVLPLGLRAPSRQRANAVSQAKKT